MRDFLFFLTEYARLSYQGRTPHYAYAESMRVTAITFDTNETLIRERLGFAQRQGHVFIREFLAGGELISAMVYWPNTQYEPGLFPRVA